VHFPRITGELTVPPSLFLADSFLVFSFWPMSALCFFCHSSGHSLFTLWFPRLLEFSAGPGPLCLFLFSYEERGLRARIARPNPICPNFPFRLLQFSAFTLDHRKVGDSPFFEPAHPVSCFFFWSSLSCPPLSIFTFLFLSYLMDSLAKLSVITHSSLRPPITM